MKDATEDVEITKNITLDLGGKTLTNNGAGKATITIAEGATATVKNGSVVGGVVTWGYLLPFFLSNLIANIYGFYQNKKTTFKSDAPWYSFAFYIVLMIALILFSTWFQGWLVGIIAKINWAWIQPLARTIAGLAAGFVQMVVLFPMEKFVLLKEKKKDGEEVAAEAAAE